MDILSVFAGVLLARIVGDGIAAVLLIYRAKKRKAAALDQLKKWEELLASQEAAAGGSDISPLRGLSEITE